MEFGAYKLPTRKKESQMKGTIVRSLVAVAATTALTLSAAGVAAAAGTEPVAAGSSTSTSDARSVAKTLEMLRDTLVDAAESADMSALTTTTDRLEATVGAILSGETPVSRAADSAAAEADQGISELQAGIAQARSVPDPLAMLNDLVQTVLTTVGNLIDTILGSAPALPEPPLPAPPLPEPPLPEPPVPAPPQ